jgi:cytochrome c oxidase subunit 2
VGLTAAAVLAGCTQAELSGSLPTGGAQDGESVTNHTEGIISMWVNSWIVLFVVGLIAWGLILWAAIVYRRRRNQTGLPAQLRYNLPVEVAYTIIPFVLIVGFFAFTAKEEESIEAPNDPTVEITAYGKQWSWDFNYLASDLVAVPVHEPAGIQAQEKPNGTIDGDNVPVLWLPVGEPVKINLEARDVIHSFWVPDFLYKKDNIPGQSNAMYFTPMLEGEYYGKCAELCGEYHSQMLFKVNVVSAEAFQAHLAELAADPDTTGELGADLDRDQNFPQNGINAQPQEASPEAEGN